MNKAKLYDKREFFPIFLMAVLFVVIHGLALFLTQPFIDAGIQPAFENPNDPLNIVYIFVIILVITLIILVVAKFFKKRIIQVIILGAIGYTAAFLFYPLLTLIIRDTLSVNLPISGDLYILISAPEILAIVFAVLLVFTLYKYPEWYVIDISGIVIGAGAIAIFGMSLGVPLVIIFLIVLAIYDAISVYKTKHMIELADTVMDLKLPVLLVIPKIRNYSLLKETKSLKKQIKKGEERDAFFMGLGDIVMPGILVVAAYYNHVANGLPIALSVMVGTLVGFAFLMVFVVKGKPQAGLPLLCGGAICGYFISNVILFGELEGLRFLF
jgi:presenilin-like A22 family membrane protease